MSMSKEQDGFGLANAFLLSPLAPDLALCQKNWSTSRRSPEPARCEDVIKFSLWPAGALASGVEIFERQAYGGGKLAEEKGWTLVPPGKERRVLPGTLAPSSRGWLVAFCRASRRSRSWLFRFHGGRG